MQRSLTNSKLNTDFEFDRMLSIVAVGLCLVVSLNIRSVKSSETVQSSAVVIGERVELKCNKTAPASWKYTSWNSSTETNIYFGRDDIITTMRTRYKIDKNISGQHNLIIDFVDWAHAGRYRCTRVSVQQLNDVDLHVQLTVLGSHPVCSGNTSEADVATKEQRCLHLSIWCSISYTGNVLPVFNWTKSNAENIAANATTSGTDQVPLTSISLITPQLQANDSGATFYCRITFPTPSISPDNVIDVYEYTWSYTLYGPKNLNISEHGDCLECSADGNPIPIYKWINFETNISINGSVYILNFTKDKEHTLYCTAENIFASLSKNYNIKGRVNDSNVTSDVSSSLIGHVTLAFAGSLVVLLIIIIIFACVVYRKRRKDDSSVRPDVAFNTDLASHDGIALSSELSPNYILAGNCSTGRSDGRMISGNAVYTEVCKPKGSDGRMISDNAVYAEVCKPKDVDHQPQQQTNEKLAIGKQDQVFGESRKYERGYTELMGRPPAFHQMDTYRQLYIYD